MNRSIRSAWGTLGSAALAVMVLSGVAEARNPHCAGGIQYVVQGMRDKLKENYEDYQREMIKAVQQLELCSSEDPADLEALGYLAWAYAELDSAGPAGQAFEKAIKGLEKGDPKKLEMVKTNLASYWTTKFNDGIAKINSAQTTYPDFTKKPEGGAEEAAKAQAKKLYDEAIVSLTKASLYKPNDPRTLRNIGSVYAFKGEFRDAEKAFAAGLAIAPADSDLVSSMRAVRTNYANQLIDEKKYDEAIGFYDELLKANPTNGDLHLGLADGYFKRAQTKDGDARKPDFKIAGDHYKSAGEAKATDADLFFNAALAYQNAGDFASAEGMWRATLKLRPEDGDAMSALGSALSELKKYDEAVKIVHQAVVADPKNKSRHRQLGAVYTKAENNAKATEELMAYLALDKGQPAADVAARAKGGVAGAAGSKVLAESGNPDQILSWEADGEKYDTWFYWTKKAAYHFKSATLVKKSDWAVADLKTATNAGKK